MLDYTERTVLPGYFDDAGTHDNSDIVLWAGFVGTESQWTSFNQTWDGKLREPLPGKPPLRRFHMSECEARDGEFAGYSDAEKDAVIHDFRQIIIESGVTGRAVAVERKEWDRSIVGGPRRLFGDAEEYCFADCLSFAMRSAEHDTDRAISLVFDSRPHREAIHRMLAERHQRIYNGDPKFPSYPHLREVSFCLSYYALPLQAADILAWETYRVALHAFKTGEVMWRPHVRRLIETGRVTAGLADKQTIAGIARLFDATNPSRAADIRIEPTAGSDIPAG